MKKQALITGASRGIGLAVAGYFAEKNYDLTLIARDGDALQSAKSQLERLNNTITIHTHSIDLGAGKAAYDALEDIAEDLSHIDVVFNNAGVANLGTLDLEYEDFSHMIDVNVKGFFAVAQIFGRKMKAQQSGYIMNLASMSGKRALVRTGGYAASKFAVVGFNQALRQELAPFNVKVTALCPGVIDTDMTATMQVDNKYKMTTGDIVTAVDFLVSMGQNAIIETLDIATAVSPEQMQPAKADNETKKALALES